MMTTLRKYMKHVMWIVAVTFIGTIVFSWGMGGFKKRGMPTESGEIGEVNGQKLMYQQFALALEEEYKKIRESENLDDLTEYRRSSIRDQVWNTIVREILMADEVRRQHVTAAPEEIVYHLRNNPPEFLRTNEQFQTNGQFDMSKYQQALSDPRNFKAWIPIENYYRTTLPLLKLQQNVLATIRVTDKEAEEAYREDNEKVNVKYVWFDPTRIPASSIHVKEKDMKAYYKTHQKDYAEPEQRKIQYVILETKPTAADSAQAFTDAEDLVQQFKSGADFATLARENSEDRSNAEKGGDLGFFGKGAMVKPFEDAAFAARVGDIVGPVQTPFGLHIIQVTARKMEQGTPQVHARHILITFKTSPETQDAVSERAQYLADEIAKSKGKLFETLVKEEQLEVRESEWFERGGFIPGLGMASRVNYFAFEQKRGWTSPPMGLDKNIILFRIADVRKARQKSFEEVKPSIEGILVQEMQKTESGKRCEAFLKKIAAPSQFESAASGDSLEIKETGYFSLKSYVPQIGRDPRFIGAAFRLSAVGQVSESVEGQRGFYALRLVDRTGFDPLAFAKEKNAYKNTLLQRKQNQVYAAWMKNLMDNARIKDYRDSYY